MDDQFNVELFEGKNLSDIFKEIYTNHNAKKSQIKDLIDSLMPLIDGIGDATLLVPLIKEYMELGIKNDEQLVKLAQIVQRMDSGRKPGTPDGFDFDSIQSLITESNNLNQEIQQVVEEPKKEMEPECQ